MRREKRFNPCCSGLVGETSLSASSVPMRESLSFNPCCSGLVGETIWDKVNWTLFWSFNPCCSGLVGETRRHSR